jgi:hypothetical protein
MTVQVGLLTRGSMPFFRLPGPKRPSGTMEKSYPLTVAGAVADLAPGIRPKPHRIPMRPIYRSAHLNAAMMAVTFEMSMRREALLI